MLSQSSEDFPPVGVEKSLEFDFHCLLPHLTRDVLVEEPNPLSDFSQLFEVDISKHRGDEETHRASPSSFSSFLEPLAELGFVFSREFRKRLLNASTQVPLSEDSIGPPCRRGDKPLGFVGERRSENHREAVLRTFLTSPDAVPKLLVTYDSVPPLLSESTPFELEFGPFVVLVAPCSYLYDVVLREKREKRTLNVLEDFF